MTLLAHCGSGGDVVQLVVRQITAMVVCNVREREKMSKQEEQQHLQCEDVKTTLDPQGW